MSMFKLAVRRCTSGNRAFCTYRAPFSPHLTPVYAEPACRSCSPLPRSSAGSRRQSKRLRPQLKRPHPPTPAIRGITDKSVGTLSSLTGTLLLPALKGITLQGTYIRRSARPCEPLPSQEPLHSMPERYLEPRILPWPLAAPASNLSTLGVGSASPRLAHYDRKLRSLGQTETFDQCSGPQAQRGGRE